MASAYNDNYASYKLLATELAKKNYKINEYELGGSQIAEYTNPNGKKWLTRIERISYPLTHSYIQEISKNKSLAYELAGKRGISVPHTLLLKPDKTISQEVIDDLFTRYKELVVKPEQASLSNGVTLHIRSKQQLFTAIESARDFKAGKRNVLVQQQVSGEEVRFVAIEGRVAAALLRRTPYLLGDGVSSIEKLLSKENNARKNITKTMVPYPQLSEDMITIQDRELIPEKGAIVELSRSTMISRGASVYNVLHEVHESYIRTAEKLVSILGADFIVVDLMIQDFTEPQSPDNMYFNEYNNSPVLKLFYSCRDGKNYDILPELSDAIDRKISK